MQRFRVDPKTFLGLAMPNQCCHVVTKLRGLQVEFSGKKTQTLVIPIYSTTILYDTIVLYDKSTYVLYLQL